jgi:ipoprotein LpqH
MLAAGISGCSSNKPTTSGTVNGTSFSVATGANAAPPTVTIDGKNQNVSGQTVCTTVSGLTTIAVGGAASGISVVLTSDNTVKSVGLGNVNGVTLAYAQGSGQGDATATKNGNGYKITGNATGVDMANPMAPVKKPFEIDVTCS